MNTPARSCPCGAPVARWRDCPAACKAGYCKACFERYLRVVESVQALTAHVQKMEQS
jgi:hypothetical protein